VRVDLEENKALVHSYYEEVLTRRNSGLLRQLMDPSFVSYVSDGPDADADAYAAAVEATYAAFPDLVVTVHDGVAEGGKVVARWIAIGIQVGPSPTRPPPALRVTGTGIHTH